VNTAYSSTGYSHGLLAINTELKVTQTIDHSLTYARWYSSNSTCETPYAVPHRLPTVNALLGMWELKKN